jgi:hypothetical protein
MVVIEGIQDKKSFKIQTFSQFEELETIQAQVA